MTDFYNLTPAQQAERYEQLARAVLPEWGLQEASLNMIKMRENAVFRVESRDGSRQVLRIHRAGYHSDAALRSELQWTQALSADGIETPEVIPTRSGELFVVSDAELAGQPRQIDMFAWVDGEQLGSVEGGLAGDIRKQQENFRTIGALAAQVHNHASGWSAPAGFLRHAWDVDGLTGERPFWGRFWDLEALKVSQRQLMLRIRERLRADLLAYGQAPANYSMIHADMVPENVLVDGSHVRLIDFDDAGYGWHLFEMATSLYFSHSEDYFDRLIEHYIAGYRSRRELSDENLEALPMFMLARATTYLGWVHTRRETETAREMTPIMIEMACASAEDYLSRA